MTILKSIRRVLPKYDYLYLGDNARAPYGTHSFDVIYQYTLQAVRYLLEQDCTLVILACNTASAKALRTIQQKDLPEINHQLQMTNNKSRRVNVLGVIRPTVEAVPGITKTGHVGILATPATVSSESYVLELEKTAESQKSKDKKPFIITQQACPMWVPLIEAGEHKESGADYFVEKYLREILSKDPQIDTLVLGCTHYPLLKEKIDRYANRIQTVLRTDSAQSGSPIQILAQGDLVAASLADYLARHPEYEQQLSQNGTCRYMTTENADRFSQSASLFIGEDISAEHITL